MSNNSCFQYDAKDVLRDYTTKGLYTKTIQPKETKIKEILKENGYPRKFLIKQHQNQEPSQPSTSDNLRQRRYVSVPYIKGTSERASRILKKFNIKLGSKPSNTLQNQLGNAKQKRNTKDKSNVVYEIDCENCEKKYIGKLRKDWKKE